MDASAEPTPAPVTPEVARQTWRTLEPLHGMVYFAPEAAQAFAALGLEGQSGYFASRAAPMGPVAPATVVATFFNFRPSLVAGAMAGVWETTSPEAVLAARLGAADGALRRLLGDAVGSPEMGRAASLARRAAERAAERPEGRPLFAGHAGLPWPDEDHLVLWHAQTLLREFRGDGHIAELVAHGVDATEAVVLHEATGELPAAFLRATRGWDDAQWDAAASRLADRGWLAPGRPGDAPVLTAEGAAVRQAIEDGTDRAAVHPYGALGEEGCAELRRLARPFSRAVVGGGGLTP